MAASPQARSKRLLQGELIPGSDLNQVQPNFRHASRSVGELIPWLYALRSLVEHRAAILRLGRQGKRQRLVGNTLRTSVEIYFLALRAVVSLRRSIFLRSFS